MTATERKVEGVLIKKLPYREHDLLLTWYTRNLGKVRVVAKASRLMSSRLAPVLQLGATAELRLALRRTGGFYVLTGAVPAQLILADHSEMKAAFLLWLLEVINKAVPDHQTSPLAYKAITAFLDVLREKTDVAVLRAAAIAFLIQLAHSLGFALHEPRQGLAARYFSVTAGGFFAVGSSAAGFRPAPHKLWLRYLEIKQNTRASLEASSWDQDLFLLLLGFLEYHLEQAIKSSRHLGAILKLTGL